LGCTKIARKISFQAKKALFWMRSESPLITDKVMHEMSLALNIMDIVAAKAKDERAEKINTIEIDVGSLAGVQCDSLQFCMEAACKGTLAEQAEILIHELAALGHCEDCGHEFQPDFFFTRCSNCNGYRVKITQGKELKIRSINID